jgi:pSer/pThr/pTyr-binding forkhead associated (FHA) protein
MAKSKNEPEPTGPSLDPEATSLETLEEIREAVRARGAGPTQDPGVESQVMFRPQRRPPMALLCIIDDGRQTGEWLRLRGERFIIGREEGDLVIPQDAMISGRHAELSRRLEHGRQRWFLTDLQSTNGTYVRINHALLRHNQELLIGSHRYRFDAAPQGVAAPHNDLLSAEAQRVRKTLDWQPVGATEFIPALVQFTAQGDGPRFFLPRPENWLGRDAKCCTVPVANDVLLSPRHARFYRDSKSRWHVENAQSVNGTWLRIEQMVLQTTCQFQLGEQRFLLRIL